MLYAVLLFVFGIAMGIVFIWDVGGLASRARGQDHWDPVYRALARRMPWWPKAFGVWCIVFSVGELVYVYGLTHGMWS